MYSLKAQLVWLSESTQTAAPYLQPAISTVRLLGAVGSKAQRELWKTKVRLTVCIPSLLESMD